MRTKLPVVAVPTSRILPAVAAVIRKRRVSSGATDPISRRLWRRVPERTGSRETPMSWRRSARTGTAPAGIAPAAPGAGPSA